MEKISNVIYMFDCKNGEKFLLKIPKKVKILQKTRVFSGCLCLQVQEKSRFYTVISQIVEKRELSARFTSAGVSTV